MRSVGGLMSIDKEDAVYWNEPGKTDCQRCDHMQLTKDHIRNSPKGTSTPNAPELQQTLLNDKIAEEADQQDRAGLS
ncbi:hypothetical protein [Sphingobacterium sp. BIGb0165]|uniref:hypothetical protein n=1 Tax=Sphingobacterium sp. BIGb0165 TaxID=2940615 RepID=UPI002169B2AD|nr:hypothetical protein [Sphingobacterium sp. BIGb0165]MCS4224577.1 hypothetical protein [Sphingobacterium sp. BIGb0165]